MTSSCNVKQKTAKFFPHHWPFVGDYPGDRTIPSQKAIDAELSCSILNQPGLVVKQKQSRDMWIEMSWRSAEESPLKSKCLFNECNTVWYVLSAVITLYNMTLNTVTEVEYKSKFESTKGTPYLTLTGKLWGVFSEDFGENWSHYNGTELCSEFSLT